ncbi:glypican-5-like [Acanthaster planci]|uniref:Glypican-5-like n=1 Tax=Acanthaster planci TaxID=133434 RepID=A0A8B7Y6S0_ACAPL|nr:glypican-5-like [Acanthaster planci]
MRLPSDVFKPRLFCRNMETSVDFQRFILCWLGLLLFFSRGVLSQLDRPTCGNVRDIFTSFQFARDVETPESPISGAGLKVCQRDRTCCTRRMEEMLQEQAEDDFRKAIQTSVDYLDFLLSSHADDFKEEFEELLGYGEAKVQQNFRIMYVAIALDLDNDIRHLFSDLRSHLNGKEVKIQRSVRNFFDELFPLLYSQIDKSAGRLDALFSSCLSAKRAIIQPFGDVPRQMATLLYHSVETSRLLLRAVEQGQQVLNATFSMALGKKCGRSLLEMRHCGLCQGQLEARPCRSYCLNVVKGCLANFMDLDTFWDQYVTAVIDLIRHSMMRDNDLQQAMNSLEYLFKDAINYAFENEGDITYEVHRLCGYPSRGRPSPFNEFAAANPPVVDFPMVPNPSVPLDERLLEFVESLDRSRGVYHSLPAMMCTADELGSTRDDDCWTGRAVGEYSMAPVQNGLGAQMRNPEVSWTGREFELLQAFALMDKLEAITHAIRLKLQGKNRRPDNGEFSGSGSGSGCYGVDDEDCISGSGDSARTETGGNHTDMVFTTTTEETTAEETDFHFDATTPLGEGDDRSHGDGAKTPTDGSPTPSQFPFRPTRGKASTHRPPVRATTARPSLEEEERGEVPESTTPGKKDEGGKQTGSGAPGAPRISALLVSLCLLVSCMWHRH